MGASQSSRSGPVKFYATHKEFNVYKSDFKALGLEETDVYNFYKAFTAIDDDGSNEIALSEFCLFMQTDSNGFVKRIFNVFDWNNSNSISFVEFVVGLWGFCTLSDAYIVNFVFDVYDKNTSGAIEREESEIILKDLYGSRFEHSVHALKMATKLKSDAKRKFTLDDFRALCNKHSALLYPAVNLRLEIRKKIIGERQWGVYDTYRATKYRGKYKSVHAILTEKWKSSGNLGSKYTKCAITDSKGGEQEVTMMLSVGRDPCSIVEVVPPRKKSVFESLTGAGGRIIRQRSKELAQLIGMANSRRKKMKPVKPKAMEPEIRNRPRKFSLTEVLFERVEKATNKSKSRKVAVRPMAIG
mmetsp:Transcript_10654/g.16149  ORF Transcript_10654/g.16149 Transcript_10654/m.16149 type:complete len:356 (+) Transcript_10654:153-1220(+)|eukprot:CAMPEP_0185037856 /NCGR_PEP_ID=MMETSP1103-20130426/32822_1 /TAXON_ID=36769 /ORGANISM="Paraphysomonas bandaiensis, Strain Caron Lab Isolate" /LENGTH=355 /DNA_ID=CAMNT_0027576023 /DNA_START=44 /DNA_END=1111 /DNA_ORIENTATION=-